ncbi:F-box/RNI-like/FBD-like domains-containing protein [Rhynchospora pubera]|uniref:F-box/RNI-like/FBD-like domains-containing protein n=2 Tax=Rhynchospora pubera TaxID=906938 RepID=A0AAV8FXV4_9POAL|nr:F-box/RNI-like/FBD-like domains-containing protein [Rhynchospora pubera]
MILAPFQRYKRISNSRSPRPLGSIFFYHAQAIAPSAVRCLQKCEKNSCTPTGTRSMEPPHKHPRRNDEPTMSPSLPDLSTLPELVLIHILSFMDPKEAVQTCILSKRWRNLWTYVTSLNFNKSAFKRTAHFVRFVTNMLFFRGAIKLDTFRLYWLTHKRTGDTYSMKNRQICASNISSWIFSALSCKPLTISLVLHGFANLKLPHALFTCASLEQLELGLYDCNNEEVIGTKYVNLPSLKKLELAGLTVNDPVMQMILSGCPLLEELCLSVCSLKLSEMRSDLLRSLTIRQCQGSGVVEIFMPSLISLHLKNPGRLGTILSLKNTPSLVKVFVFSNYFQGYSFSAAEFEFFTCLTSATDLKLYGSGVMALLEQTGLNCPVFDNLKRLTFGRWQINNNLDLLCLLLQHTPNLEKLTIVHTAHRSPRNPKKKGVTGQIPFRCEQLRAIEIKYSDPSGVHELVDILLRNTSHRERVLSISPASKCEISNL